MSLAILKQCKNCKDWKSKNDFYFHKTGKEKLNPRCKKCVGENGSIYAQKISHRFTTAKRMALRKKKGFSLFLSEFEYVNSMPCFYCDGYFGKVKFSGGLDRINNNKGYELMNVLPCCAVCNRTRQDILSVE